MVERLHEAGVHDDDNAHSPVRVQAFWKPAPRYQQKPWSVRAFQMYAALLDAHLMVVDADIQFNYWEVSARSLADALLDPLEETPGAAMVCLNAPRSFYTDDGVIHLWTYLFAAAVYRMPIHQLHGGEFSLHRALNAAMVTDRTILHDRAYCLQGQLTARAALAPQYGRIAERQMRGKWHAKIVLSKLLIPDPQGVSRMDMVTERMFQDALLLAAAARAAPNPPAVEQRGVMTPPHPGMCSHLTLCSSSRATS